MKIPLTLFILLSIFFQTFAQKKLTKSRESGYYTYIYKLTNKETFEIAQHSKSAIKESFLHTLVDSFYTSKGYKNKLAFGNYLYINASKNDLNYHLNQVKNVDLQFVNNLKEFQFYITDQKGNYINNAKVEIGKGKTVRFDRQAKLYKTSYPKEEEVIKIDYQGVSNFFTFDLEDRRYNYKEDWSFFKKLVYASPIKYTWQPFKKLFRKRYGYRSGKPKYSGYMVFSKPKYKPLDTVKFKAYVLTSKGKIISNKDVEVVLFKDYNSQKNITTLKPYKNGGYEYSFVLADSLNLKLDQNYRISLLEKVKNEKNTIISGSFNYEDYELKSLTFAVRTDKEKHQMGAPITVFLKATDENELAVPDGRVEITALTNTVSTYFNNKVFVPDTLWKKSLNLDPVGETKLVLPDSIFPKADLNFSLRFDFRNSNNESRSETKFLYYRHKKIEDSLKEIKSSLKKDSLFVEYKVNDKSEKQSATIVSFSNKDIKLDSVSVELPATLKIDFRAEYYEVKTQNGVKDDIYLSDFKPDISIGAMQSKDSLRVVVNNENKIPFWYTIFSGNKIFLKGFTNVLDTTIKHTSNKAAHIRINYYWDEEEKNEEVSAFYNPNFLNVKLLAPDMVYPGQKVNMLVKVTDIDNKPVAETDLTAYASTSKFKNHYTPTLPDFSKRFFARKKKNIGLESEDIYTSGRIGLNWQKWGRKLGLDTIEYYKFTHPNQLYAINETANDTLTEVAPFTVVNGAIEPVHIVYIDEIPVFFDQSDQLTRYSFQVKPGKHSIRLRTYSKMISLNDYDIPRGKKTILSILADSTNKVATVKKVPNELSVYESQQLDKYMFKVKDNFDGGKAIIQANNVDVLLNPPPNVSTGNDLLIGPLKENYLTFKSEVINQDFIKEPGYTYTFTPGLIKQKSYADKLAFNPNLSGTKNSSNTNYTQYALRKKEIDSIWNDYLDLRSHTTQLFTNNNTVTLNTGRLDYKIDTSFANKLPYIKNIIIYKPDQPDFIQIYAGNNIYLPSFEAGNYKIMFLLKDNRYFVADQIVVQPKGINHYKWNSFKVSIADAFSLKLDNYIKSIKRNGYYGSIKPIDLQVVENFNDKNFDLKSLRNVMTGRLIDENDKSPIPGAAIRVVGLSTVNTTDANGRFSIKVPENGKINISYIGYESFTINVTSGDIGEIKLKVNTSSLNEVVVVGYGVSKKQNLTASAVSITSNEMLSGKVAGLNITNSDAMIRIRGTASLPAGSKPIIIVDGVPFSGDISSLSPDDISHMDVLKGEEATAIYGSSAANGVIIIKTKKGNSAVNLTGEVVEQQQTMRTNFNDEGFWQPKLITDETGTVKFTVKFPDDITKWTTRIIAMNGNKQTGYTETSIKSFKSLSANFVSPLFAVKGDSMNVIGKLMNYTPFEERVNRKFSYNGMGLRNSNVKFKNAHIDTVSIAVTGKDSLNFEYTLKQDNGYFDGEIRKIPVFEAGVMETKGYFSALLRDTSITYNFDKNLGKVTVRAESSVFPTLLDEMKKLRNYEYLCNEQLASKLKSLLLEKRVRTYLNQPFNYEKDIKIILKKLNQTKKPQGTWAWWQNGEEQIWISLHVVEALLQAEKQGYTIDLNKKILYNYLVNKLTAEPNDSQIQVIKLLHLLDDKYDIKDWVLAFEKKKLEMGRESNLPIELLALKQRETRLSTYGQLVMMELKQMAGLKINIDSLIKVKKQTMFGGIYWGEENFNFWDNSIQNTLMAYKILKAAGNHEADLEKISLYFLEQRKDGQWRNTFESSLILETILPEMLSDNKKAEPASLTLNNETVSIFPYNKVLNEDQAVKLTKKGKMAVYFTAYQQFQNPKPEKVSKDFTVNSSFIQNGNIVKKLKAGTLTTLKVEVNVRADAEYVMIEVPIPAGCSYENKMQNFWGIETHREYLKNKTSIFCTKLKQGKYTFNIDLMPRYSGSYILNPAKAEMMYFPVFYGREGMKKVGIN